MQEQAPSLLQGDKSGNPLLYSVEDCEVIGILTAEQPEKKEDIVYVGHGNQLPSTATYAMLDFSDESPWTEELPRQHH